MLKKILLINLISDKYVKVDVHDKFITVYDSYKIVDDLDKVTLIKELFKDDEVCEMLKHRTKLDVFYELKAHNILYSHKLFRNKTGNTDLELKQNRFIALCYKLIYRLFSEKHE